MNAPCKNCIERFVGCHGTCSSYKEYRAYKDNISAIKKQIGIVNEDFRLFKTRSIKATKDKSHKYFECHKK